MSLLGSMKVMEFTTCLRLKSDWARPWLLLSQHCLHLGYFCRLYRRLLRLTGDRVPLATATFWLVLGLHYVRFGSLEIFLA